MPKVKPRASRRKVNVDDLKSTTLTDRKQEKVKGGKIPVPSGPIPIPYPNASK